MYSGDVKLESREDETSEKSEEIVEKTETKIEKLETKEEKVIETAVVEDVHHSKKTHKEHKVEEEK